jgi:hypothetical protein
MGQSLVLLDEAPTLSFGVQALRLPAHHGITSIQLEPLAVTVYGCQPHLPRATVKAPLTSAAATVNMTAHNKSTVVRLTHDILHSKEICS